MKGFRLCPKVLLGAVVVVSAAAAGLSAVAGASTPKPVTTSEVTLTFSSTLVYGTEAAEPFTIYVVGTTGNGRPEGKVTVDTGSTAVCTTTSSSATSTASLGAFVSVFTCVPTGATVLAAGPHDLVAAYATPSSSTTTYTYTALTSGAEPVTVQQRVPTTAVTLTLSASSTTYGAETDETFTVRVTGTTGDGLPEGKVVVDAGSTAVCATATSAPTSAHSAYISVFTCSPSLPTGLPAGSHLLNASYTEPASSTSTYFYTAKTSATVSLSVNSPTPETTSSVALTFNPSSTTYGAETTETFTVTVSGQTGYGRPEGKVTVETGTAAVCTTKTSTATATHSGYVSNFTCSPATATALSVGPHELRAAYTTPASSTSTYIYTSTASSTTAFTVKAETAVTSAVLLGFSPSSTTYGSETGEHFDVSVVGTTSDGRPEGRVTVKTGTTTVCTTTSSSATSTHPAYISLFSCTPTSAIEIPAGVRTLHAAYTTPSSSISGHSYSTRTSELEPLTVAPESLATSAIALSLTPTSTSYGQESAEAFTVKVTGTTGDGRPEGMVTVESGATTVCTTTTSAATSTAGHAPYVSVFACSPTTATELPEGSHTVHASYTVPSSSNSDYTYTATASGDEQLVVGPEPVSPAVSLTFSAATVAYDAETPEIFTVKVAGTPGDGLPEGTASVETGSTTVCTTSSSTPTATFGTYVSLFSCSPTTPTELAAGPHSLHAAYTSPRSSDADFAYAATTSVVETLTVAPRTVTTSSVTLALSAPSVTRGDEGVEIFTVKVTGTTVYGRPEGKVSVKTGNTTVCATTTSGATATDPTFASVFSCHPSDTSLPEGMHTLHAAYTIPSSSDADYAYTSATSGTASLDVAAPKSSTSTTTPSQPTAPAAPSGATSHQTCSVATGSCNAVDDDVTVAASPGPGALTVSQYASDPEGTPGFASTGSYFDVEVASGSSFSSVTVKDCNVSGATLLHWWDATTGAWEAVSPVSDTPPCLTAKISSTSVPSISQLTGTVFGAGTPAAPTATAVYGTTADATAAAEFTRAFPYTKGSCPSSRAAVVATTKEYQDALSSQFLAGDLTTGTLLTPTGTLSSVTATTLEEEGITTVYVVGGPLAITTTVAAAIGSLPADGCGGTKPTGDVVVHRISGATQYGTAMAVAGLVGKAASLSFPGSYATANATGGTGRYNDTAGRGSAAPSGSVPTAVLASGEEFQDAQAASVVAYRTGLPLLLTPATTLSTTAVAAIEKLGVKQVIVMGGPLAVTDTVEAALVAKTGVSVLRVAGKDYTDTARELARFEVSGSENGLGWTPGGRVMVARGNGFTDGLCGAVLENDHNTATGASGAARPLLLTENPTAVGAYLTTFLETTGHSGTGGTSAKTFTALTVLGGPLAVTSAEISAMETDLSH